jgi:hypothetical protein
VKHKIGALGLVLFALFSLILIHLASSPRSVVRYAPDDIRVIAESASGNQGFQSESVPLLGQVPNFVLGKKSQLLEIDVASKEQIVESRAVYLDAVASRFVSFCDGRYIGDQNSNTEVETGHSKFPWKLLEIPAGCTKLQILATTSGDYLGIYGPTFVGTKQAVNLASFMHQLDFFFVSLIMILTGVFVGFLAMTESRVLKLGFYLSLLCQCTAVYFISRTSIRQWILPASFPWFSIELASLYLCPALLVLTVSQVWKIEKLKKFVLIYSLGHFTLLCLTGLILPRSSLTLPSFQICLGVSLGWISLLFWKSRRRISVEQKTIFISISFLLFGTFADLFKSAFNLPWIFNFGPWGFAAMIVGLSTILHHKFRVAHALVRQSLFEATKGKQELAAINAIIEEKNKRMNQMWEQLDSAAFVMGDGMGNSLTRISMASEALEELCNEQALHEKIKVGSENLSKMISISTVLFKTQLSALKSFRYTNDEK